MIAQIRPPDPNRRNVRVIRIFRVWDNDGEIFCNTKRQKMAEKLGAPAKKLHFLFSKCDSHACHVPVLKIDAFIWGCCLGGSHSRWSEVLRLLHCTDEYFPLHADKALQEAILMWKQA